jgi:protein-disulfide isomerase
MIRSQFSVPSNCDISIGPRTPSTIPDYENLHVRVSQGSNSTGIDLLISIDGKTLARFERFDLDHNPELLIDVQGRPIRGNPAAPVTVVGFDDLECPVCSYMHQLLFPAAFNHYGDSVRFIYKDNPLVELHPWALRAAVDATCLADQSGTAYWSYVDYVHSHGEEVSGASRDVQKSFSTLDRIAGDQVQEARLDSNRLQACLKRQDETPVRKSMKEAEGLDLNFTPALFVNGEEVHGFTSVDDVWDVIDRALRESGVNPPQPVVHQPAK